MNFPILALLSISHLVTDLSGGILPLLLPGLKEAFNLSYTQAGMIIMMSNLSSSVIQPLFGYLTDRQPMPWLMPAGILVTGIGLAAIPLVPNFPILLVTVLAAGLGVAAFHPEASKTAYFASGQHKASSMAVFSVGGNLGIGLGPLLAIFLLGLAGLRGMIGVLIPTGVMAFLLWRFLAIMPRPETVSANQGESGREMPAPPPSRKEIGALVLLVLFVTVRSWIHAGMVNYIPLYYVSYLGGGEAYAGTLITAFLIAGAVGTLVGGPLADRLGPRRLIIFSMVLSLPLIYWFRHSSGLMTIVPVALSGAVTIATFAPTIVFGQSLLPRHVGVASGLMMGFGIGMGGVGVTLLGPVADSVGVPTVLLVVNLLPVVAGLLVFLVPRNALQGVSEK